MAARRRALAVVASLGLLAVAGCQATQPREAQPDREADDIAAWCERYERVLLTNAFYGADDPRAALEQLSPEELEAAMDAAERLFAEPWPDEIQEARQLLRDPAPLEEIGETQLLPAGQIEDFAADNCEFAPETRELIEAHERGAEPTPVEE